MHAVRNGQGITVNKSVEAYLMDDTWLCKNVYELIVGFGLYNGIYVGYDVNEPTQLGVYDQKT